MVGHVPKLRFPDATRLLITADAGGSNGYRVRAWKSHLAAFASETGLAVQCAYDPNWYPNGVKISDRELAAIPITPHDWHREWNDTIAT